MPPENKEGIQALLGRDDHQTPDQAYDWQPEQLKPAQLKEVKAMTQVSVELPETVYSVLHCSLSELDKELRLAALAQWY